MGCARTLLAWVGMSPTPSALGWGGVDPTSSSLGWSQLGPGPFLFEFDWAGPLLLTGSFSLLFFMFLVPDARLLVRGHCL